MTHDAFALDVGGARVTDVGAALRSHADSRPDGIALAMAGDDVWSYQRLDARARSVAASLSERCVVGDRVVVVLDAGPEFVATFFGCLYAGLLPVPLAYRVDGHISAVRDVALDARPRLAVVSTKTAGDPHMVTILAVAGTNVISVGDIPDNPSAWGGDVHRDLSGGLAFLQYTSGSTAAPKGVMVSHENLLHNIGMIRQAFGFDQESRMLSWLPHNHDMGLIGTIVAPVVLGVPTILMTPAEFIRQPVAWLRAISDHRATISGGPNFAYDLCVARIPEDQLADLDLSSWRVAFNGAEPVAEQTVTSFASRFAPYGFDPAAILPCYGLAEATLLVAGRARASAARATRFERTALDAGRARVAGPDQPGAVALVPHAVLADSDVTIVDDRGRPLPDGCVGEVWVSGPSVAAGYWKQPEQNVLSFQATVADSERPHLRTGDLGFLLGNELYIRGRLKDVVIVRGRNVHLADVETVLRPLLGGRVAAFRIDSDQGEALGAAYTVSSRTIGRHEEAADRARAVVAEQFGVELSDLVPLRRGGFPTTTSGKLRRAQCSADYAAGAMLRADRAEDETAAVAEGVQVIMAQLSRLCGPRRTIDAQLPLSRLGLDSLKAIEFQLWLEQSWGLQLGLAEIMDGSPASLGGRLAAQADAMTAGGLAASDEAVASTDQLSYGQEAIWLQEQLSSDPSALVLSRVLDLAGSLDVDALDRALQAITTKHAALRTRFAERGGRLRREITTERADVQVVDATLLSDQQVRSMAAEHARRPVRLDSGRLLRAVILRRSPTRYLLVLSTHHIAMDVWSLTVLFSELTTAYLAELGLRPASALAPASLGRPAGDYGEFVAQQRRLVAASTGSDLAERWRQRLAAVPAVTLPTDHARPRVREFRGLEHSFTLTSHERDTVASAAARCGVSPATFLCGIYAILLGRLSGQGKFVLGYVSAGRQRARFRDTIGYFVNTLPVAVRSLPEASVAELMACLDREIRASTDDGGLPLARIVEIAGTARSDGRGAAPLVSACFAYQSAPGVAELGLTPVILNCPAVVGSWGDALVSAVEVPQQTSYFDLSLYLGEHEGQLLGVWNADAELFERQTVEAFAAVYIELLRRACQDLNAKAAALPAGTGTSSRPAVAQSSTACDEAAQPCAHNLFEQQVRRSPDRPAILFGDEMLTYGELNLRANRIAHRLIREGIGPEDRVGLLAGRTANSIAAVLGVLKAGAAYVPLDPGYPRDRLEFIAADAGITVLLADVEVRPLATALVLGLPGLVLADEPDTDPPPRARPGNAAYLVYTSGSTGTPNGAIGLHQGITSRNLAILDRFPFDAVEVCCHKTALSYLDSCGEIFLPLIAGVPIVVVPDDVGRDPVRLVELLCYRGVTRLVAVPSLLSAILDTVSDVSTRLSALRYCHSSGEELSAQLAARLRAALPACVLVDLYGSSETSADATLQVVDDRTPPGTVGSALPGMEVQVLGPDGEQLPPLVPGDVFVGGVGLSRGYAGRPGLTAARFVPDPSGAPGTRMFVTGDRGRMTADGRLQFIGRVGNRVKIRGHRVELGEIDAVIAGHPDVAAALTGVRDDENYPQLVTAVVVRTPGSAVETQRAVRIGEWLRLYERLYSAENPVRASEAWTSSLTGEPFSDEELDEWISSAAQAVRQLRPRRILEIGCGSGNILLRLMDEVEFYAGTDFSPAAVTLLHDRVAQFKATRQGPGPVIDIRVADAGEAPQYPPQFFDVVVINSVTQYLPGHDYVLQVLRHAVDATRPGGAVFAGDVRDLTLFRDFHEEVAKSRLGAAADQGQVASWVDDHMRLEKELLLSPDFFLDAARMIGRVSSVDLLHKRGRLQNELTRYRYDAVLRLAGSSARRQLPPILITWDDDAVPAAARVRELLETTAGAVEIRNVPNGRLGRGLDPEEAWSAGLAAGRRVALALAASRDPRRMDLRIWPKTSDQDDYAWSEPAGRPGAWADRANDPLAGSMSAPRAAEIRDYARRFLPAHAVPVIEIVDKIPTTATGKLSRRGVGRRPPVASATSGGAPVTMLEHVTAVWRETLGLSEIPPDANFFDLGGHSLSLVQVHVRLQELLSRAFALADLYDYTTTRELATYLEGMAKRPPAQAPELRAARRAVVMARRALIRGDRPVADQ